MPFILVSIISLLTYLYRFRLMLLSDVILIEYIIISNWKGRWRELWKAKGFPKRAVLVYFKTLLQYSSEKLQHCMTSVRTISDPVGFRNTRLPFPLHHSIPKTSLRIYVFCVLLWLHSGRSQDTITSYNSVPLRKAKGDSDRTCCTLGEWWANRLIFYHDMV